MADQPNLTVPTTKRTNEDHAINLGLSASLIDSDGSEILTVWLSGLVHGATLSDGVRTFTATASSTSVDLSAWTLSAITLTPPLHGDTDCALTVTATATELNPAALPAEQSATISRTLAFLVDAVADAPTLTVAGPFTTNENQPVNVGITAALVDSDGSETLSVTISGVAVGATLTDGTNTFTGAAGSTSVTVTSWTRSAITIKAPDQTSFTLTVTATATETNPTSTDLAVSTLTASTIKTMAVTVNNLAPGVTITPTTQIKQYSDTITPIVITATDVTSDTLNVTTAWSTNGTTFTAGLPDELMIAGGLALTGAANQVGTASWTISGVADLDPAKTYTIRVTVADEDGGATVQDLTAVSPTSDAHAGLITKATVTFINRETGAIIASNVPITLLNPADPKTGTAVYNWTVTLPNNANSESYTIGTLVTGSYTRNASADNTVVTVSLPQNDFLTGGGYLVNQSSAGIYAGDVGQHTNFGFNVKFNKQLTNLQGKANVIIRQGDQIYQIKTNATNSLSTTQVSPGVFDATFTSKANLTNITDLLNPIALGGNLDLIVILRDAGEPGTADTIGMTLWQGSTLLYSSHWTGTHTVKQLLGGGNLHVRTSSPLLAANGAHADEGSNAAVTAQQLAPLVEEATARWIASGLTAEQAATLSSLQVTIADLEGATIGLTDGTSVLIDRTAAGYGWFIDPTPQDHAEFHFVRGLAQWIADAHSPASDHMDLLTTVMHELGHVLGFDDQSTQRHSATLMTETLPTGVRRSVLTDLPADPVGPSPSPQASPLAPPSLSAKALLDRSITTFTGVWGNTGTGKGSATPTTPVIDWTEVDEHDSWSKKGALGASALKASWLQRFLFHTGREEAKPHDHGIEVVLPGKKK